MSDEVKDEVVKPVTETVKEVTKEPVKPEVKPQVKKVSTKELTSETKKAVKKEVKVTTGKELIVLQGKKEVTRIHEGAIEAFCSEHKLNVVSVKSILGRYWVNVDGYSFKYVD